MGERHYREDEEAVWDALLLPAIVAGLCGAALWSSCWLICSGYKFLQGCRSSLDISNCTNHKDKDQTSDQTAMKSRKMHSDFGT